MPFYRSQKTPHVTSDDSQEPRRDKGLVASAAIVQSVTVAGTAHTIFSLPPSRGHTSSFHVPDFVSIGVRGQAWHQSLGVLAALLSCLPEGDGTSCGKAQGTQEQAS